MRARGWVREFLTRAERAEEALKGGDAPLALDTYAFALQALFARWPAQMRTEDELDDWFEELPGAEAARFGATDILADVLWLRGHLEVTDGRRAVLLDVARRIADRLDESEELHRDALLTSAVLAVAEGRPDSVKEADALCARYPEDPYIPLELSRACGHFRPREERDLRLAERFGDRAIETGGEEVDLLVYEDRIALLLDAEKSGRIEAFERAFWTPERICRALETYGPAPPRGAIEAVLRHAAAVKGPLLALIARTVEEVTAPVPEGEDDQRDASAWAASHGLRLAAALALPEAVPHVVRALGCDASDVRAVLPLAVAGIGSACLRPLREALRDRDRGLLGRLDAVGALTALALLHDDARAGVLRTLRATVLDGNAPRALRSQAAFRLMGLRDEKTRETVLELLAAGDLDRNIFDEDDVAAALRGQDESILVELGLDEAPLAPYFESDVDFPTGEPEEIEAERIGELVVALAEALAEPEEPIAPDVGPLPRLRAEMVRARRRAVDLALEEVGLGAWAEALRAFVGSGGIPAQWVQRLGLEWEFTDFLTLDLVDEQGKSVLERLLERPPLMTADQRQALSALAASRVSALELLDGAGTDDLGSYARCRDLITGATLYVSLPTDITPLPWDVLIGRIAPHPRVGLMLLYGRTYPRVHLPAVLSELGSVARELAAVLPESAAPGTPLRVALACLYARRCRAEVESDGPVPRNIEGDIVLVCEAHYRIGDTGAACAAFETLDSFVAVPPGEDHEDEREHHYRWLGREGDVAALPDARRVLGEARIKRDRLVLSCHSREWLARGRALIEGALGAEVRHLADTFADPIVTMNQGAPGALEEAAGDEHLRLLRALIEQHYRDWLDRPLPGLGGRSPREAAGDEDAHEVLSELLRTIDNLEAHRARMTGVAYDTSALYHALGLGVS